MMTDETNTETTAATPTSEGVAALPETTVDLTPQQAEQPKADTSPVEKFMQEKTTVEAKPKRKYTRRAAAPVKSKKVAKKAAKKADAPKRPRISGVKMQFQADKEFLKLVKAKHQELKQDNKAATQADAIRAFAYKGAKYTPGKD